MFCNKCGSEIPADSSFCVKCGAKAERSAMQTQSYNTVTDNSSKSDNGLDWGDPTTYYPLWCALFVVLGIILTIVALCKKETKKALIYFVSTLIGFLIMFILINLV